MSRQEYRHIIECFILTQRTHFVNAMASFGTSKTDPAGVAKWGEGSKQYYRHAVAVCNFMLQQAKHYRDVDDKPDRNNPKRGA
jgi:hypothetical protein